MISTHNLMTRSLLLAGACFATNAAEVVAGAAATPAAKDKPKTVLEDMASRRLFDTPEEASAYLNNMGETLSDFEAQHFVLKGISANETTGSLDFDPAIYTDQMRVMVAVLTQRVEKGPSKVTAIVVTPAPKMEAILATDTGKAWAQGILDKELNHVAVRAIRNPKEGSNLDELAEAMPTTLEGYITSTRADGGALEVFNELNRGIITAFAKKSKAWEKMRLTKNELRASMSSKAYAAEYYPTLEDRGEGKPSLFVMALEFGKAVATSKGLDPAIFDRWLSTRDETKLTGSKTDDSDEDDNFDLSALEFVDTAKSAEPATEVPVEAPTPEPAATA